LAGYTTRNPAVARIADHTTYGIATVQTI